MKGEIFNMGSVRPAILDVRVAFYECTKGNMCHIAFYNELYKLLECKRVKLLLDGDRLYFRNGDSVPGSLALVESGNRGVISVQKNLEDLKPFEGEYTSMLFDASNDTYYIDRTRKLTTTYGPENKTSRARQSSLVKGVDAMKIHTKPINAPVMSGLANALVAPKEKSEAQINAEKVIVSALLTLLETQITDNPDAMATLTTLRNYI